MRIEVSIEGDLGQIMAGEIRAGERAVSAAMRGAALSLKENWRSQIRGAGLGTRLANAVRSEVFPRAQPSLNATALVYSKAPKITAAHETGATIRARNGFWLAIPTPAAGKGRKGRITPIEWEQKTGRALRFVYWGGRIAKLVDDGTVGFRRLGDDLGVMQSRAGKRTRKQSRLIFILVPQAKLKKKLSLLAAGPEAASSVPAAIIANWRAQR